MPENAVFWDVTPCAWMPGKCRLLGCETVCMDARECHLLGCDTVCMDARECHFLGCDSVCMDARRILSSRMLRRVPLVKTDYLRNLAPPSSR
jgi:hypothetical protein